ncbi:MAG: flavodoxin-dependent (E)-4-hydroxy-3-methylbut-2-enyl-diphosphate synthase [Oscillospiraceae bacterium]|nr:flavodoxin-dependent (E)-4-hydroxy-3-methylbut-2-enyl-diphosphate synthase [Oscillospiraceae bacterium]
MRKNTRKIMVGGLAVGGGAPVSVQSMLCAPPGDIPANTVQAAALEAAGCQVLRVAIPDRTSIPLIPAIKRAVNIPLVADIHFDYKLALESVAAGVDKIRINPGNIGGEDRVAQVARACREKGIPIRVGVNAGSLEKEALARHGGPTPAAMVESALNQIGMLERHDFYEIAVSLKSSDVAGTVAACRLFAEVSDYPQHIGVTESGTERMGTIKSAIGIGSLLLDGIGDTIRVSLTADPVAEVKAGIDILRAVGLRGGVNVISCPTCGRCKIDLIALTQSVESAMSELAGDLTVAVMGCAVNGPGEAAHADIGVAGGDGEGLLFAGGKVIEKVPQNEILPRLVTLAKEMIAKNLVHKREMPALSPDKEN